jgi:hypothetical protein
VLAGGGGVLGWEEGDGCEVALEGAREFYTFAWTILGTIYGSERACTSMAVQARQVFNTINIRVSKKF